MPSKVQVNYILDYVEGENIERDENTGENKCFRMRNLKKGLKSLIKRMLITTKMFVVQEEKFINSGERQVRLAAHLTHIYQQKQKTSAGLND